MNRIWIKAALIRAAKTTAQTAIAVIGTEMTGVLNVDWKTVASVSVLAGILSLLTSVAGLPEVTIEKKQDPPFDILEDDEEEEEDEEEEDE